jgi:hypothetical protein
MNGILVDEKYGFRPNISTEITLHQLINEMNNKISVGGNFVTWRKLWTV